MQKPDRIGAIAEHERYLLPELRRLGFRTSARHHTGARTTSLTATLKRGSFSLFVEVPRRGYSGMVVAWEGNVAKGNGRTLRPLLLENKRTLHLHEVIAYVNGSLYLIESLAS